MEIKQGRNKGEGRKSRVGKSRGESQNQELEQKQIALFSFTCVKTEMEPQGS
jgi:hypothetical protein